MTAFRILFVQRAARSSGRSSSKRGYVFEGHRQKPKRSDSEGDAEVAMELNHVAFPRATLTGMRTFIDGRGEMDSVVYKSNVTGQSEDRLPLKEGNPTVVENVKSSQ